MPRTLTNQMVMMMPRMMLKIVPIIVCSLV